jgi:hypothetical protein
MKKLLTAALLLSVFALTACERDVTYDKFAQCLTDEGVEFYGAFWCHNCESQKDLFGDSVDLVPYIECAEGGKDTDPELCAEKKIEAYPTWDFPDSDRITGVQSLETLSKLSGCPLPSDSILLQ